MNGGPGDFKSTEAKRTRNQWEEKVIRSRHLRTELWAGLVAGALIFGYPPITSAQTAEPKVAILHGLANQFQSDIGTGAAQVAKENNIEFQELYFNLNSQRENEYVSDLITKKVDLIIYGANDANIALANFKRIQAAKIPIVCFDTCIEPSLMPQYVVGFVTSDNEGLGTTIGRAAADYIKTKFGGKASVAFVTCDTEQVCGVRHAAINKALESVQVQVVANQVALSADQVKTTCEGILTAHPDLNIVITDGLAMTVGCVAAIANLKRPTVVFGMDITSAIAQDLLSSNGVLQATIGQDGTKMGQIAMQMAVDTLNHKTINPPTVLVPGKLYTRANSQDAETYLSSHH
jgi:sugar transport system substrate-binding protein